MDRRNFFKIVGTASAGAVAAGCNTKHTDKLIPLLVTEHEIVPGREQWHPAVCTSCGAGCGTLVRVMEGQRVIERNGEKVRERIACAKKIEGNPLDPISGGRLCARGHASLQGLYHPDRVQGPLQRTGDRGKGEFKPISWDEAINGVAQKLSAAKQADASKIQFLMRPVAGSRAAAIGKFQSALGAGTPLSSGLCGYEMERAAAEAVYGWKGLPVYDIAQAHYVVGIGADFLGGWTSPVYYARQFGAFRQGRERIRGKLVQAESRMSITAQSADVWIPLRPGSEGQFAQALAQAVTDAKGGGATSDLSALLKACGVEEKKLRAVAKELAESDAPLVISGASVVHSNSQQAIAAGNRLNVQLGNVGKPGGVLAPAAAAFAAPGTKDTAQALTSAKVLLLDGANPLYTSPAASQIAKALSGMDLIVSFAPFIDDTAAYADFILPDHHELESYAAVEAAVSAKPAIAIATAFVRPLYNTRAVEQTLTDLAGKMQATLEPATVKSQIEPLLASGMTFEDAAKRGGYWGDAAPAGAEAAASKPSSAKATAAKPKAAVSSAPASAAAIADAVFDGAPDQYPFILQPYLTTKYQDGSGANLPWMQEMPDSVASSMWGLPVEIDPQTAVKMQIVTGDRVKVESTHGSFEAAAYVHPAAVPGVVSMGVGDGHTHYGRYASGRGANPLSILAPAYDNATGTLCFGDTRVKVTKTGPLHAGLIQFSPQDREQGPWGKR